MQGGVNKTKNAFCAFVCGDMVVACYRAKEARFVSSAIRFASYRVSASIWLNPLTTQTQAEELTCATQKKKTLGKRSPNEIELSILLYCCCTLSPSQPRRGPCSTSGCQLPLAKKKKKTFQRCCWVTQKKGSVRSFAIFCSALLLLTRGSPREV